jgi:hypothetical protein
VLKVCSPGQQCPEVEPLGSDKIMKALTSSIDEFIDEIIA